MRVQRVVEGALAFRVAQEKQVGRWLDSAGVGPVNLQSCYLNFLLSGYRRAAKEKVQGYRRVAKTGKKTEDSGRQDAVLTAIDSHMSLVGYATELSSAYCLMSEESLKATKRVYEALAADAKHCQKLAEEVGYMRRTIETRLGMVQGPGDFVAVMESDREIADFARRLLVWLEKEAGMAKKD